MEKIELDRTSFKALASDTRIRIIKKLHEKDKRITDLSKDLDLTKPTISEHLKKLEASNLVQRKSEQKARKRVYYGLTEKSKSLLEPKFTRNVKILLGLSIISFIGGLTKFYQSINTKTGGDSQIGVMNTPEYSTASTIDKLIQNPPWLGIILLITTLTFITVTAWYYKNKTPTIRK